MPLQNLTGEPVIVPWAHLRIPPFPQVAIRVLQLANNDHVPMRQLDQLISCDPAFSSELLTLANSPLYARRTPVTTMLQAIALLGTQTLKGLCLTVGVRTYLGDALRQESLRSIWRHSLACALIAEQLAVAALMSKDTAYTAGIMHDIGRLALAVMQPKAYAALLETHAGSSASLMERERELFGFDHCEAGSHLIADWKLPPGFQSVVAFHHQPREERAPWRVADIINVSCRMADAAGFSVFAGCEHQAYSDLLAEIPARERGRCRADVEGLAFEIGNKINTLESL